MKHKTRPTPETDAVTGDFDSSAAWTTEDFQKALRTIEELKRERDEALQKAEIWTKQVEEAVRQVASSDELYRKQCKGRRVMLDAIEAAHLELSYALGQNLGVVKNHVQKAIATLKPFLP